MRSTSLDLDWMKDQLRRDAPELQSLRTRYRTATATLAQPFWKAWEDEIPLRQFRGEVGFMSQMAQLHWQPHEGLCRLEPLPNSVEAYRVMSVYAECIDHLGVMCRAHEDGLFGAISWWDPSGRLITRDLLESCLELNFLADVLGLDGESRLNVLDVGAGYGRLAHRIGEVLPSAHTWCVDAVATATYVSELYLRFRGMQAQSTVVPFDRLDALPSSIDLATNVHSWSECSETFIRFWLERLRDLVVPTLFVVPSDDNFTTIEPRGRGSSFLPLLQDFGYHLKVLRPKFADSPTAQRYGVNPAVYAVFEHRSR